MMIDRDDDPWRSRNDLYRLPRTVVEAILILIPDKNVMTRMAFVLIAIKKIIAQSLIPASLFSPNGRRSIPLQRKTEAIVLLETCRS